SENKGALSVIRKRCGPPTDVITTCVRLKTSTYSRTEDMDNEDVENATYDHYDETEKPLQSFDWYSEIPYIYQDQRFKGQDEFLGGNVAGGPAGRRCLRKTNDFQRITATRRERVSRIYTNIAETVVLVSKYRFLNNINVFAIVVPFCGNRNTD
ncbi:hypothetical protein ALC62_13677, partial [Cyphomyrmex costatus]